MKIIPHLKAITSLITSNLVTQVEAETGTGKSVMIPSTLALQHSYTVFVAVPRVTSAISLHEYAKKSFPSVTIGYGAEGNKRYTNHTKVVYATSGHIKRRIFSALPSGSILFCDVLIVDEVHTGSTDNAVILGLWKYMKDRNMKVPKLVMLSATPTPSSLDPVVYPIAIERPYPVEIVYYPDVHSDPNDTDSVYNTIVKGILDTPYEDGDILVFAHGARAIEDMIVVLSRILPQDRNVIIGAYAALSSESLNRIYNPSPNGERKIIIATNIAESSITLDGVGVVFDSLFENRAFTSSTSGLRLSTVHISKDSAQQRLGRTGRTRAGICHRVISHEDYDALDMHTEMEILRVPLHEVVMEFISAGIDPVSVLSGVQSDVEVGYMIDRKVRDSVRILTELRALDGSIVTDLGHFMSRIPMGVYNAAFLYRWLTSPENYPAFPGIVTACLIDVHSSGGYFYFPYRERNETNEEFTERYTKFMERCIGPFVGTTGVHTYLNVWRDFSETLGVDQLQLIIIGGLQNRAQHTIVRDWMNVVGLHRKKWLELLTIIKQTVAIVASKHVGKGTQKIGLFNASNVHNASRPILMDVYRSMVLMKAKGNTYVHERSGSLHILSTRTPISELEKGTSPAFIIPLDSAEIKSRYIISLAIPYEFTPQDVFAVAEAKQKEERRISDILRQMGGVNYTIDIRVPNADEVAASIGDVDSWDADEDPYRSAA